MKKKKRLKFPTAFTVLFIVLIIADILTYVIPAGNYSKLNYKKETKKFEITNSNGNVSTKPPTQKTLDDLNIKIEVDKFIDGSINKPIAIPNTYKRIKQTPQKISDIVQAPVKGTANGIDIVLFILVVGGLISIVNATGAFESGFASLSKVTKGKEFILLILVNLLIGLGGTTFGFAEETIALYPILTSIFLATGYDSMVCIAIIYVGSTIGTMFSTVNPFATVIASNSAGISFTEGIGLRMVGLVIAFIISLIYVLRYAKKVKDDPSKSLVFDQKEEIEAKFLTNNDNKKEIPQLNFKLKLILILFGSAFIIMVYGVVVRKWWFTEMTALFLVISIIVGIISDLKEKECVDNFLAGAGDVIGVGLIIGVARSINLVLENGNISDTLLYFFSNSVQGMNSSVFAIVMLLIFMVLGLFIPSSSGLAVLSMPIMAPLADTVGISRAIIVSAFQFGHGLITFITPTGIILAALSMVDITYDRWLKFIAPLLVIMLILSMILLSFAVII
ncbi:YfcC family protein [Clostridium oceanicum]|uniref:YfcC family protein n=1 Tax=Clostridium oceanicum TaxID=1543 RepID=A0ABN1JBM6_9CLOT